MSIEQQYEQTLALFKKMNDVCVGHDARIGALVASDLLAGFVGMIADNPKQADDLIDTICIDMKRLYREKKEFIDKHRQAGDPPKGRA